MRRLYARSLEALVAGTVLAAGLIVSAGCVEGYRMNGEDVKFNRQQTSDSLTVRNWGRFYILYERSYIDLGGDSTVDIFSIADSTGKTTYYADSQNPFDKEAVAIAQKQYESYLSKIIEIQTQLGRQ